MRCLSLLHQVTGCFGPIPVRTPGRFGPIPFRSGRFGLGLFGPISGVVRFGPILEGRFGPLYFIYFFLINNFFSAKPDFISFTFIDNKSFSKLKHHRTDLQP